MAAKRIGVPLIAALGWVLLWHVAAAAIGREMLLPSPLAVLFELRTLGGTVSFWQSVVFSVSRVVIGFALALICGTVFGAAAFKCRAVEVFLRPAMAAAKAAPVASYIILCLLLMPSSRLPVIISLVMGLPIIYTNVLTVLKSADPKLLEMARVFGIGAVRRAVFIYFSELMPFLLSACGVALGLCWKAGVAAEVIGLPRGSIGESLYQAKVFADMPRVFAWTAAVIVVSFIFERTLLAMLRGLLRAVERM